MDVLNRGQLAEAAQVNIETLRYYERRGLIPAPPRSPANYRRYPRHTISRVRFVKHAQDLGFSLAEIRELLSLRATRGAKSGEVKKHAARKIEEVSERIRALERIRAALRHLVVQCSGDGPIEECTILHAIEAGDLDHSRRGG
ncbi:MAG TPA: heavy metal-responsive transcriptional regulator [Terriglobales bacterium]|nr:heavy metal-responsive transcriptional regulator [Terriglobales bacterium]